MRERKPFWRDVPPELRKKLESVLGSPVRNATRVFGGYGPSATFRLYLESGRTAFAKGAGKGAIAGNWRAVAAEQHAYESLDTIRANAPVYLGSVSSEGWHLLLLEDLTGALRVPPWSEELAVRAVLDVAEFHLRGKGDASKAKQIESAGLDDNWRAIQRRGREYDSFVNLFPREKSNVEAWLDDALDALVAAESELLRPDQPWGLLHSDIRSDNLCFRNGRLVLFDWALVCNGPLILDTAFFLPSVAGEGGPPPELLMSAYRKAMAIDSVEFPDYAEQAAIAATAGFFANRAGNPPIPGLPRLRDVQRMQLKPALLWVATALKLPQPPVSDL